MPQTTTCPDRQVLQDFLTGRLAAADVEQLAAHVEHCRRCEQTLRALRPHDSLVELMRQAGPEGEVSPALSRLLDRLTHLSLAELVSTPGPIVVPAPANPAAAFLAPPQGPNELGRLGHYRVLRQLGEGGMGMVFAAEDTKLGREVALKVMRPELAADAASRERFLREARAAASVHHDHIIPIYQVDEEGHVPYLAMPLLKGLALEEYLNRGKPITVAQVLRTGREVARGLAAAHAKGLIHRDIKPANVWLEAPNGRVKILDFGLARAAREDVRLTQSGLIVGTPAYMAPEQARGKDLDGRCDLFSLGCVLYRMITGRPPFDGETTIALLTALALDDPKPLTEVSPDLPPALADLIHRLLAKEADQRPQSAQAVVDAIVAIEKQLANGTTGTLTPVAVTPAPGRPRGTRAAAAEVATQPVGTRAVKTTGLARRKRKKASRQLNLVLTAAGGALAMMLLLLGWRIFAGGAKPEVAAAPTAAEPRPASRPPENRPPDGGRPEPHGGPPPDRGAQPGPWPPGPGPGGSNVLGPPVHVLRHPLPVNSLAFTPDGTTLVTATGDYHRRDQGGALHVWDLATDQPRSQPLRHPDRLVTVAVGHQGRFAAAGGEDGTVKTWNLTLGREEPAPRLPVSGGVHGLALTPAEPTLLAVGTRAGHVVYTRQPGGRPTELARHAGAVFAVAFSPDGKWLASAGEKQPVTLYDLTTGQKRGLLQHSANDAVHGLAFSPDGKRLASAGWDRLVKVWDLAPVLAHPGPTAKAVTEPALTLGGGSSQVNAVAFSPDGRFLAAAAGDWQAGRADRGELRLWEMPGGRELPMPPAPPGRVAGVAFSPDGALLAAACWTGEVIIWETGGLYGRPRQPPPPDGFRPGQGSPGGPGGFRPPGDRPPPPGGFPGGRPPGAEEGEAGARE